MSCRKLEYYHQEAPDKTEFLSWGIETKSDPGQKIRRTTYTFAFQGQERDDEIRGRGNSYAFTYRIHDPRLGRFLSIDPLARNYPYYSTYSFSGNRVIDMIELEGAEPENHKFDLMDKDLRNWAKTQPDEEAAMREGYNMRLAGAVTGGLVVGTVYLLGGWGTIVEVVGGIFGYDNSDEDESVPNSTPEIDTPNAEEVQEESKPQTESKEPEAKKDRYSGRYEDGQKAYRTNVPRDENNVPEVDSEEPGEIIGRHTRLQPDKKDPSRTYSGTEFDDEGNPVKRVDHAGRKGDELPHEHKYNPETKGFGPKEPLNTDPPEKEN